MVDMLTDKYDVSRNSRRWTRTVFYALLNISNVNAHVLYAHNPQHKLRRRKFMKNVCLVLLDDSLQRRLKNMRLPKSHRATTGRLFPAAAESSTTSQLQSSQGAKRCTFCVRSKDRKVKTVCRTCGKHVCSDHIKVIVCCTN